MDKKTKDFDKKNLFPIPFPDNVPADIEYYGIKGTFSTTTQKNIDSGQDATNSETLFGLRPVTTDICPTAGEISNDYGDMAAKYGNEVYGVTIVKQNTAGTKSINLDYTLSKALPLHFGKGKCMLLSLDGSDFANLDYTMKADFEIRYKVKSPIKTKVYGLQGEDPPQKGDVYYAVQPVLEDGVVLGNNSPIPVYPGVLTSVFGDVSMMNNNSLKNWSAKSRVVVYKNGTCEKAFPNHSLNPFHWKVAEQDLKGLTQSVDWPTTITVGELNINGNARDTIMKEMHGGSNLPINLEAGDCVAHAIAIDADRKVEGINVELQTHFVVAPTSSVDPKEYYIEKSQINATSGVAGLNENKQLILDVNNNQIKTNNILVKNNPTQDLGQTIYNYAPPIPGGYEPLTSYNTDPKSSIVILSQAGYDYNQVRPNTLMIGGNSYGAIAGIKASCQNTSSGDMGGSCYQFTDMGGLQNKNRSGAERTDGINIDIRSSDNSPLDVIGGNELVENADGTFTVKGISFPIAENVSAKSSSFKVKGMFSCGLVREQAGCKVTGITVLNANGKPLVDGNGEPLPVKVTPGQYNSQENTTQVLLPANYTVQDNLTPQQSVVITLYSTDGIAYGVKFLDRGFAVYPVLSQNILNLIHNRMAIWSNMTNGMMFREQGLSADELQDNKKDYANYKEEYAQPYIDMPDYYYGYNNNHIIQNVDIKTTYEDTINPEKTLQSVDSNKAVTKIYLETAAYPGSADAWGWLTLKDQYKGKQSTSGIPGNKNDDNLKHKGDEYDYKIANNSNFHRYSQPTVFLGLNQKNLNLYTLQKYTKAADSITREYDNKWEYQVDSDHDGQVDSRGLTLTWKKSNKRFSPKSYMMNLSGAGFQPLGLSVNGVWNNGGKLIDTDIGLSFFNWADPNQKPLQTVGDEKVIAALGQASTKEGAYQLFSYLSNDGNIYNNNIASANNSLHFGLTKKSIVDSKGLQDNHSPTCIGLDADNHPESCSVLGQVIFDPLDYVGGIALGSGQGNKTNIGLVVDKNGNSMFKGRILDPIMISSASYEDVKDPKTNEITHRIAGQGSVILWNKINNGDARTEYINVESPNIYSGGFDFL